MDNAKHTPDLLPCPFCGSAGEMLTNSGGYIECLICNAFGPTVNVSRGSAERYWNTRATPALLARLARAEAALDAVDQVLESRIDQWESDDDLSDWVKPAKIIQADVAAEILAQIEERGE